MTRHFLTQANPVLLVCAILVLEVYAADALTQKLELAAHAESRNDFATAHGIYKKATLDHPESAQAWAAYGEHLRFYAHEAVAAETAFKTALKAKTPDAHAAAYAWRGLGELAIKEHRDDEAIAHFKESLKARPLADTHRSLCHLYCSQRKFKEAAEQAKLAFELNADDPIARLLYAAQLHRAGEVAEGRKQFDQALAISGLKPTGESAETIHCCVYYNAAGYLGVAGLPEDALAMLRKFFGTPNHRHLTRAEIENDADFVSLKGLPAFQKLLDAHAQNPTFSQSAK